MGTFTSFRKAYGALKDTTKVGLAKVNSDFKDLDIAIVKATNHVECPPKERHVRRIFSATSVIRPRADVAYCIHALAKRLSKTKNWVVAIKVLIVIHRTLREGDPTFREELLNFAQRGNILQISNFKDDSGMNAWDCSAWVRAYALFLEERLSCFSVLKYDIEAERLSKLSPSLSKVHTRTRILNRIELLDQLPALQQLLYRLIGCQPEGTAYSNYLVQYALALILKESFKIYCAINDGIINLVDMFFDMTRHDAIKALAIYKRAGQQAENLAEFYEQCKGLDLARTFQFPTLRQPPPSFLATMEEYIKEAPQSASVHRRVYSEGEDEEDDEEQEEEHSAPAEVEPEPEPETTVPDKAEEQEEEVVVQEPLPLVPTDGTDDLLGLSEINPRIAELDENNALALAILPPGQEASTSTSNMLAELGQPNATGWELALVTAPSCQSRNNPPAHTNMAGGFDKLLLDSLYEDETARKQIEMTNAGYRTHGSLVSMQSPYEQQQQQQHDPFMMSNSIAPPTNVQLAMTAQHMQLYSWQQQTQSSSMVVPFQNMDPYQPHQHQHQTTNENPFGDPFSSSSSVPQNRHMLL
ncbi:Putative clathrin assembly protein At5g57200 [Linum grandiflorum]